MKKEDMEKSLETLFGDEAMNKRREHLLPSFIGQQVISLINSGEELSNSALKNRFANLVAAPTADSADKDMAEYALTRLPLS